MKRIATTILFIFLGQMAFAEGVKVTSGEHADFSRIVLQFSDLDKWTVTKVQNGYLLDVTPNEPTYILDQIFQKIPRTRIQDVSTEGFNLKISTSNNVHIDAFEIRAGRIVLDIKDGPAPANSPFEQFLPSEPPIPGKKYLPDSDAQTVHDEGLESNQDLLIAKSTTHMIQKPISDSLMSSDQNNSLQLPITFTANSLETYRGDRVTGIDNRVGDNEPENSQASRSQKLELDILKQIGRSVSQGLLDPELAQIEETISHVEKFTAPEQKTSPKQPKNPTTNRTHITVQSSVDRAQPNTTKQSNADKMGNICIDDQLLDVAFWGSSPSDSLQISALRADLIGEFDSPNPAGITKLARYYIYLSFGAEARSLITNFGVHLPNADILMTLSNIMDGEHTGGSSHFSNQFRCQGHAALWSAFSQAEFSEIEEFNIPSILSSFSDFPIHLRQHLGPKLSEKFLSAGDDKTAKAIQSIIARAGGEENDAFKLLDAELKLSEGDISAATRQMESVVHGNGPTAAIALIKYIETQAHENLPVAKSVAENAEAMAFEHKSNELAVPLQLSGILARILAQQPELAMEKIHHASIDSTFPKGKLKSLRSRALSAITQSSTDLIFAKSVFEYLDEFGDNQVDRDVRIAVATRLMDLGFSEQAQLIVRNDFSPQTTEESLLMAEISYAQNRPERAIHILDDITGARAAKLRANILFDLNQPQQAANSLSAANLDPDIHSFLAEDWNSLEHSERAVFSETARIASEQPEIKNVNHADVPLLGSISELLDASKATRSTLNKLFSVSVSN